MYPEFRVTAEFILKIICMKILCVRIVLGNTNMITVRFTLYFENKTSYLQNGQIYPIYYNTKHSKYHHSSFCLIIPILLLYNIMIDTYRYRNMEKLIFTINNTLVSYCAVIIQLKHKPIKNFMNIYNIFYYYQHLKNLVGF